MNKMGKRWEVNGLVSILIGTYNRPELFEQSLNSARAQTYPKIEIIVCDNSTDDATEQVMERYRDDERIRYVRNEGATKDENYAPFEYLARGEYVQYLMDDDLLAPEKVEEMMACFRRHPDVTLISSRRGLIDIHGNAIGQMGLELDIKDACGIYLGEEAGRYSLRNCRNFIGEPTAALYRRRDIDPERFRSIASYRPLSDAATWLALMEKGNVAIFRDPLSYYRRHGGQEGQQPDMLLLSRLEWLRLGREYYDRRVFLKTPSDYAAHLEPLIHEDYDMLANMEGIPSAPLWPAYCEAVEKAKGVFAALGGTEETLMK